MEFRNAYLVQWVVLHVMLVEHAMFVINFQLLHFIDRVTPVYQFANLFVILDSLMQPTETALLVKLDALNAQVLLFASGWLKDLFSIKR